jgi:hypothetical protein
MARGVFLVEKTTKDVAKKLAPKHLVKRFVNVLAERPKDREEVVALWDELLNRLERLELLEKK